MNDSTIWPRGDRPNAQKLLDFAEALIRELARDADTNTKQLAQLVRSAVDPRKGAR